MPRHISEEKKPEYLKFIAEIRQRLTDGTLDNTYSRIRRSHKVELTLEDAKKMDWHLDPDEIYSNIKAKETERRQARKSNRKYGNVIFRDNDFKYTPKFGIGDEVYIIDDSDISILRGKVVGVHLEADIIEDSTRVVEFYNVELEDQVYQTFEADELHTRLALAEYLIRRKMLIEQKLDNI